MLIGILVVLVIVLLLVFAIIVILARFGQMIYSFLGDGMGMGMGGEEGDGPGGMDLERVISILLFKFGGQLIQDASKQPGGLLGFFKGLAKPSAVKAEQRSLLKRLDAAAGVAPESTPEAVSPTSLLLPAPQNATEQQTSDEKPGGT